MESQATTLCVEPPMHITPKFRISDNVIRMSNRLIKNLKEGAANRRSSEERRKSEANRLSIEGLNNDDYKKRNTQDDAVLVIVFREESRIRSCIWGCICSAI